MILIVDECQSSFLDSLFINSVDTCEDFWCGEASSVRKDLLSDILCSSRGSVQLHEHLGLELNLGALHFLWSSFVAQSHHRVQGVPHQIIEGGRLRNSVHAKQASVLVLHVERHKVMSQLQLRGCLGQLGRGVSASRRGAIPITDQSLQHHQWEHMRAGRTSTLERQCNVSNTEVIVTQADVRTRENRLDWWHNHARCWL
mmetsp:Transcript_28689/g.57390  ORF Transcript_28689/g.57390 Transcript_28689/m.57390 type:complete len:200 (-) Transcript_28689:724-1323(-)